MFRGYRPSQIRRCFRQIQGMIEVVIAYKLAFMTALRIGTWTCCITRPMLRPYATAVGKFVTLTIIIVEAWTSNVTKSQFSIYLYLTYLYLIYLYLIYLYLIYLYFIYLKFDIFVFDIFQI